MTATLIDATPEAHANRRKEAEYVVTVTRVTYHNVIGRSAADAEKRAKRELRLPAASQITRVEPA